MKNRMSMLLLSFFIPSSSVYADSETWTTTNFWNSPEWIRAGDFNGDGRTDFATPSGNNWGIHTSNGTNGFSFDFEIGCFLFPASWGHWSYVRAGDFNGDGFDDYVSPNGGIAHIYTWGGDTCPEAFLDAPINSSWGHANYTWVGDFNGDGSDDLASASGTNVYMKFGGTAVLGGGGFGSATWTVTNQWGAGLYTKVGDFNGDGLADIASLNGSVAHMKISTGSGFVSTDWSVTNVWGQGQFTFAGDFNGDGYDDIASCAGGTCYMKQSVGNDFTNPGNVSINPSWNTAWWTFVGDFEDDGVDDIASISQGQVFMKLISP